MVENAVMLHLPICMTRPAVLHGHVYHHVLHGTINTCTPIPETAHAFDACSFAHDKSCSLRCTALSMELTRESAFMNVHIQMMSMWDTSSYGAHLRQIATQYKPFLSVWSCARIEHTYQEHQHKAEELHVMMT